MRRVKRRTFSGAVLEQEVFAIPDAVRNINRPERHLRFKSEEERQAHRLGISRRKHARLVNANFGPSSLYSTLTFDNENEVHTFSEADRICNLYKRRIKYAYPDAVIFTYLGRGKSTNRIHMHMLSEGLPREVIERQWIYGTIIRVDHLREHNYYDGVDHGQDYTGLANYLFDHWTPEQGGHRWKQTKNARQPEQEEPVLAKRCYSEDKPPIAPKGYKLIESKGTPYGYLYYKYVKLPAPRSRHKGSG